MPEGESGSSRQRDALRRAFHLVYEVQSAVPGSPEAIEALLEEADRRGWGDVARAALFGRCVTCWFLGDGDATATIEELVARSAADGDLAMLALGLALRSDVGFSGSEPSRAADREADLARAIVLLEQVATEPLARISAHTACGITLGNRSLFELGDEQYALGLAVGAAEEPGSVDFLVSPILFNRAETQVAWASMLYQLGDAEGVAERRRTWNGATEAIAAFSIPPSWRTELDALGLLLAAVNGEDRATEASALAAELRTGPGAVHRPVGLLDLAAALSDENAGRGLDPARAARVAEGLDPEVHPQEHDLARFVAARAEAARGPSAGLAYGRRQFAARWSARLATLGAARSRISAERLAAERELLRQHARLDDLTGIGNRRALERYLELLVDRGVAQVALVLLDVDAFKEVNDRHGHLVGDAVLVAIASALARSIRHEDLAVRLGGDEFAVVLADTDLPAASSRAEELLAAIDELGIDDATPGLSVAMSAGVAAGSPAAIDELRREADKALYRAKAGGGNRVRRSRLALSVA